jgi:putative transposase
VKHFFSCCRREQLRQHLEEVFRRLARQKESRIEGHLMADHVHMMIAIPPKYAVSQVTEYIKGKSAIHLARVYGEMKSNFVGAAFLGPQVLCIDGGREEGGTDLGVRQEPGARGQAIGPDEPMSLNYQRRSVSERRGRVSDPD